MPGQGKAESCSGCSVLCPGLSSQALPRCPSPRCIPKATQLWALRPAPGSPEAAWRARGAAPDPPRGKVRAGPFHAGAGGLCQQLRAYLPPPWLFAFGEAPAGWGWGRPERRSLGAGRASERPSAPAQGRGGGRPASERHPGHSCDCSRGADPAGLGARGLGPRDLLRPRTLENLGLPSWALLPGPPLRCQRWSGGAWAQNSGSAFPRRQGQRLSHGPTASSWETRRHRLLLGQGCTRNAPGPGRPHSRGRTGLPAPARQRCAPTL